MKIELGKVYVTRNGDLVEIKEYIAGLCPYLGTILDSGIVHSYTSDGHFYLDKEECGLDLVASCDEEHHIVKSYIEKIERFTGKKVLVYTITNTEHYAIGGR